MKWTQAQLESAIEILNDTNVLWDAISRISEKLTRNVTVDSLGKAFKRAGLCSPSCYLREYQQVDVNGVTCLSDNPYATPVYYNVNEFKTITATDPADKVTKTFSKIDGKWYPKFAPKINECMPIEKVTKIVVCPDTHIPNHNLQAWNCFLESCRVVKPDVLVLIGDFADLASVSSHPKGAKEEARLKKELSAVNEALDQICSLNIPRIVYLFGNHENRFDRYINSRAPELDDVVTLPEELRLKERGIEYYPYGEIFKLGKMNFVHDVNRCGINTARQSLQDVGDNITIGHSHRAAVVYSGTIEGDTHVGVNVGHLLDINTISYTSRPVAKREWQTGFGFMYQNQEGVTWANFVPIIDGKCIVDGKLISL